MSKNDMYIQFEKPMTLEEYSSEEGQTRMRNAINVHRELHKAEDKKQERAAAQRSEARQPHPRRLSKDGRAGSGRKRVRALE